MFEQGENVYYYITTLNENYSMPAMPEGVEEGIVKGLYRLSEAEDKAKHRVQLMGCGAILREVIAAAEMLRNDWGVEADVWSAPSFNELARDGQETARWNLLHPDQPARQCWIEQCLADSEGPVIASTDYVKNFAEQIRPFIAGDYRVLGTDGFGRSDSREALRRHFEVDRHYVTVTALKALADQQDDNKVKDPVTVKTVLEAIAKYGIDTEKTNPLYA
jgi:pyruvate dehydrogenase E1 component